MEYVLLTFQQRNNIRRYWFKGTSADQQRLQFTVEVDLNAIRQHGIPMQELPLLCRLLLEEKPVLEQARRSMFSESRMADYVKQRETLKREAEQRRRGNFQPPRPGRRGVAAAAAGGPKVS